MGDFRNSCFYLLVKENFRNYYFWHKLSQNCTESVVMENLLVKQRFIHFNLGE